MLVYIQRHQNDMLAQHIYPKDHHELLGYIGTAQQTDIFDTQTLKLQ